MAIKEITSAVSERIKAPYFGYAFLAFIAINWKALLVILFSKSEIEQRIELFEASTSFHSLFSYPLLISALVVILSPWVGLAIKFLSQKPIAIGRSLELRSEHSILLIKSNLEKVRSELLEQHEQELLSRAKRDDEVASIEDEDKRIELEQALEKVRKERDRLFVEKNEAKERSWRDERKEMDVLINSHQVLANKYADEGETEKADKHLEELKKLRKDYEAIFPT